MTIPTLSDKTYMHHILAVAPCSFESIKNWLEYQFDAGDKAQFVVNDLSQRGLIKLEDGAYWLACSDNRDGYWTESGQWKPCNGYWTASGQWKSK